MADNNPSGLGPQGIPQHVLDKKTIGALNGQGARRKGTALFEEIEQRIMQYVFIGEHERAVIVAFIVHCHTIDAFATTPRIKITSPEENCGKSLLAIDIMGPLLPTGSVLSVSITPAALYRKLNGKTPPTFVLD